MIRNKKLRKNFLWNTVGSTLYAFTSLFFLVAVTRINGLQDAGVFTFAFSNACVFVIIGTFAGRIFQVTEKEGGVTENDFFYNRLLSIGIMALLGAVFGVLKGYDGYKFAVVFVLILFKALEAMAEFFYGVMQKKGEIHYAGKSFILKALLSTAIFVGVDIATKNILLSSIMMTIVVFFVMSIYDVRICRKLGFKRGKMNHDACFKIFKTGLFVFAINILTQYLINASKYAIDNVASSEEQTIYGIIAMPATFLVLASGFLVHPIIVDVKTKIKKKDFLGLNRLVVRLSFALLGIGLLCVIGAYLLGVPIFKIIYGVDTSNYRGALIMILIGATMYGLVFVLESVLICFRETWRQVISFMAAALFSFVFSGMFVGREGVNGGAEAYLFSMLILMIFYMIVYCVVTKKKRKAELADED